MFRSRLICWFSPKHTCSSRARNLGRYATDPDSRGLCNWPFFPRIPDFSYALFLYVPPLLALHHTIVSEPELFPVKKSQKLAAGDCLLSSCGVCLTQMLLSMEPLRLEQLPLPPPPPPREKLSAEPSVPLRSWLSGSWLWSLEVPDEEDWVRLSRLWWEWNWRMWRMDLPCGTSPGGQKRFKPATSFGH